MDATATPVLRSPVPLEEADEKLAETLDTLESARNYADWVHDLLVPHLGPRVLEVGAGHGTVTRRLARDGRHVTVSEISPRCVATLGERFRGRPDVSVINGDLPAAAARGPFDAIVMVNVLEHIADDLGALVALREGLSPGGHLVVFVPAFQGLYSEFDRLIGHYRRYRTADLRQLICWAGYRPVEVRYVNLLGAVAWWLFARRLGVMPDRSWSVQAYDRCITPLVRRIESRVRVPFGQSVLCVAQRVGG